jgi:NAD(P)-dependent dehydrogenase (short-subunit alcohol dehydrogenase family)
MLLWISRGTGVAERVALITGAAKRVGRDIAVRLARAGHAVAIHCNRSVQEANELAAVLSGEGATVQIFAADLSDATEASALVHRVKAAMGAPTLLVNNASLFLSDTAMSANPDVWRRQFAVNLEAPSISSINASSA